MRCQFLLLLILRSYCFLSFERCLSSKCQVFKTWCNITCHVLIYYLNYLGTFIWRDFPYFDFFEVFFVRFWQRISSFDSLKLWPGAASVTFDKFNVHGSVHRKIYSNIYPTRCNFTQFISGNCSACFGWYLHPSSGAHNTTVSTASGICQTVTATCRDSGR